MQVSANPLHWTIYGNQRNEIRNTKRKIFVEQNPLNLQVKSVFKDQGAKPSKARQNPMRARVKSV